MVPRVLVIEPYSDLREVMLLTLRRERYACDAVADVADAALRIRRHQYDCVVVDADSTRDLVASLDPSATIVSLRKPFDRDELIAAVR